MSLECEIRVNESHDFVKIACIRSHDFSGPDQSSVTMADIDKDVDVSELFNSLLLRNLSSLFISMEKFSSLPCNSPWHGRPHEANKEVQ